MAQSHQASQKLNWLLAHWPPSPCILPATLEHSKAPLLQERKCQQALLTTQPLLARSQPSSMSLLFPDQEGTRLPKPAFTFISQDLSQQICSEESARRP